MESEILNHEGRGDTPVKLMLVHSKQVPPVNIEFENLTYETGKKQLLKSIWGQFCSGELSAILGPSGAGKTTLLKILSGHIQQNVSGTIRLNGQKKRYANSTFIADTTPLQPFLTVKEAMMIPAKLKLRKSISNREREIIVDDVLSELGLQQCSSTRTEHLSGGESKRLSIALELINNPSVMFFDEPTTGLDIISTANCLEVLSGLASQGRTVICSIHQPSISILQQFHQVYFMSDGMCVYNGSPENLIFYLEKVNLSCPITWNPADHIIEIVQTSSDDTSMLVSSIKNGKINKRSTKGIANDYNDEKVIDDEVQCGIMETTSECLNSYMLFHTQVYVLLKRMLLQQTRNRLTIVLQFLCHIILGLCYGMFFYKLGNNGTIVKSNLKMLSSLILATVYIQVMVSLLGYPKELELLIKEHSNKWYSLNSYYFALTLRSLPLMTITTVLFLVPSLIMSDQPLDLNRMVIYYLIFILLCTGSEGLGIIANILPKVTDRVVASVSIIFICFLFCSHKIDHCKEINSWDSFFMSLNFMRHAQVSLFILVYTDRPALDCADPYCYFSTPQNILKTIGYGDELLYTNMIRLTVCVVVIRLVGYLVLRYKLYRS